MTSYPGISKNIKRMTLLSTFLAAACSNGNTTPSEVIQSFPSATIMVRETSTSVIVNTPLPMPALKALDNVQCLINFAPVPITAIKVPVALISRGAENDIILVNKDSNGSIDFSSSDPDYTVESSTSQVITYSGQDIYVDKYNIYSKSQDQEDIKKTGGTIHRTLGNDSTTLYTGEYKDESIVMCSN